jgi:hypothetical protein
MLVDVPWVTLMGSPSITDRLPGVVAQRVHAAAGTCITDEHKARGRQRAGATQRGATTSVCVFITAGPITKLFAGGGGGEWRTCAMRDDEPRPVWMSPLITH